MNTTDFWYKIVDMTKSDAPMFSLGSFTISEKVFLWIVGIVLLLIFALVVRMVIMWVLGNDLTKKAESKEVTTTPQIATNATTPVTTTPQNAAPTATPTTPEKSAPNTATTDTATQTPQQLLADTSDRKRSLHDFVTPDAIHSEVLKQTLNNDFPYQTMKPDPTKIGEATSPNTPPSNTPPVAPPVAQPVAAVPVPQPPVAPSPVAVPTIEKQETVSAPMTPAPAPVPPTEVKLPPLPEVPVAPMPVTPEIKIDIPVTQPEPTTTPTQLPSPIPSEPAPAVTPPTMTDTQKAPSELPPLPVTEPRATMVVGVADATGADAVTAKRYNPTDPTIP